MGSVIVPLNLIAGWTSSSDYEVIQGTTKAYSGLQVDVFSHTCMCNIYNS